MMYYKGLSKYLILRVGVLLLLLGIQCKTKESDPKFETLKVDLDFSGRRVAEVNDPLYTSWVVDQGSEVKKSFDQIGIVFSGDIRSGWYKAGIQAPHYARLVNDGLISE